VSGVVLAVNLNFNAKQGISLDSGKDLTMGNNSRITGNIGTTYEAKTANFTANVSGHIYNATSGTFNVTLPTAVSISGREYYIYNSGTGVITINTTSSQTISGQSSGAITLSQYQGIKVISDGANWIKVIDTKNLLSTNNTWTGTNTFYNALTIPSLVATSTTATSTFADGFGVGTTTPMAKFAVLNSTSMSSFVVAQVISATTYIAERIDQFIHLITQGPVPTLSTCGTSPTIGGNDRTGNITTGSGVSVTACTMTFANAYPSGTTPVCTVSTDSTVSLASITSISTSSVTFGLSASLAGGHLYYICQAYQ